MAVSSEAVIEVKDLFKSYGSIKAVNGVSFNVSKGEVFGMLGPNGAGKTTTVEIIEGLRTPDSGKVQVLGKDVFNDVRAIKEHIGIQPQSHALFPTLNVQEIVDFFRTLYQKSLPTSRIIEMVSLQESSRVLFKNLSGGQQQRLSVGLAFINDPEIVFLDEPTTGLDPQARRAMWDVVQAFRKTGKTIFLTTHYMEEAERLCDRVAIMDHGQIIVMDSPQNMIEQHIKESAVQFKMTNHVTHDDLTGITGVSKVVNEEEEIILYTDNIPSTITELLALAKVKSSELSDLFIRQATLEDVFLKLTGKRIRD